jgi:hypothetical protein
MNKKNIAFIIFVSLILAFTYCKNIPDFPLQPVIKFNTIKVLKSGNSIQGLRLELEFTDGDGNLGLNSEDTIAPYNPEKDILGNPTNDNFYNYFYSIYIQDTDSLFKPCDSITDCNETIITSKYTLTHVVTVTCNGLTLTGVSTLIGNDSCYKERTYQTDTTINESLAHVLKRSSKARYPYLRPDSKKSPLSGTLTYDIIIPDYVHNKRIKLKKLYIKDRTPNKSNEIETDTLTIR